MTSPSIETLQKELRAAEERPEVFDQLVPQVAQVVETGDSQALDLLVREFARAEQSLVNRQSKNGQGNEQLLFDLDAGLNVSRVSAAAVDELSIEPGLDFSIFLSPRDRDDITSVAHGMTDRALINIPVLPGGRPVLITVTRGRRGTVSCAAIMSVWCAEIETDLEVSFRLSDVEIDIVRGLFEGLSPKDVARLRDRSIDTIRTQIRAVYSKTGARSVLDLAHLVYSLSNKSFPATNFEPSTAMRRLIETGSGSVVDLLVDGPRNGEPVLFFHGCLGGRNFAASARAALSHRLVIAPGRPGHGKTSPPIVPPRERPAEAAKQALHILDEMKIARTDLLAYDVGAASALTLAQIAPERVGRITLIAALPPLAQFSDVVELPVQQRVFPLLSRTSSQMCEALARLGGERLLAGGARGFAATVFAGSPIDIAACRTPEVANLFWRGHAWHTRMGPSGFVSDVAIAATGWSDQIGPVQAEITWIHGVEDTSGHLRRIEALRAQFGGRLKTVPKAGHALLHTAPETWVESVLS
ncbi:MAG: alpha/beta fold hydrolase [Pseudomonadota bacterium]